jgi:hypothetical protein
MKQKALEKIKQAEKWLHVNYGIHPKSDEAIRRYEFMCDDYEREYGERPSGANFTKGFDFDRAREKLRDKLPL